MSRIKRVLRVLGYAGFSRISRVLFALSVLRIRRGSQRVFYISKILRGFRLLKEFQGFCSFF